MLLGVTKLWLHVGPEKSVWRSKEPTLVPNERMHQMSKRTETHLGDNLGVGGRPLRRRLFFLFDFRKARWVWSPVQLEQSEVPIL